MSKRNCGIWLPFLALLLAFTSAVRAEDPGRRPSSWEPRVPIGKSLAPVGSLLVNDQPGQPWQAIEERGELHSRDLLLALPGMIARLETHGVEITLWGNMPELSSFAGLQSSVILHDS